MWDDHLAEETGFSVHEEMPEPLGRRQGPRLLTLLRVGTLVADGRRELCLVRNISAMGLMLHVYSPLSVGERVGIEMKTGQALGGRIKWIEGAGAGVEFDAPIDVMAILASQLVSHSELKPRMPRVEVRAPATLRVGAHSHRVVTRDVSQGGAKLVLGAPIAPDADVVLSMEGFHSLHGVLRWCDGEMAGVTFNSVIPWPQLVRWLKERREIGPVRDEWRPRRRTVPDA